MPLAVELLRKSTKRRFRLPTGESATVYAFTWGYYPSDDPENYPGGSRFADRTIPMKKAVSERAWSGVEGPIYATSISGKFSEGQETAVHRIDNPADNYSRYDSEDLPGECIGWLLGKRIVSVSEYEAITSDRKRVQDELVQRQLEENDRQRGQAFAGLDTRVKDWIIALRQLLDEHPSDNASVRQAAAEAFLEDLDQRFQQRENDLWLPSAAIIVALRWVIPNFEGPLKLNEEGTSTTWREDIGESPSVRMFVRRAERGLPMMTVWHASVPHDNDQRRMYYPPMDGEAPFPAAYDKVATVRPDHEGRYSTDDAWELTNSIDHHWSENDRVQSTHGTRVRSTSSGDVVQMPDGTLLRAESVGWKRVEAARELSIDGKTVAFVRHDATPLEIATGTAMLPGSEKWV